MNPEFSDDVIDYVDALLDDSHADDDGLPQPAAAAAAAPSAPGPEAGQEPAPLQPEPVPDRASSGAAACGASASGLAPFPPRIQTSATAAVPADPAMPAPYAPPLAALPPPASVIAQASRWLRVVVGRDSYALELLRVQEVVRVVPIVAMRGAQPAVLGVMNLRGRIVPVFDLGLWLGTGQVEAGEQSRIVVIERGDELIGILVSAVEDVVTLGRDRIEPPLQGSAPGAILGVARVGATPTVLFDAYALYG